MTSVGVSAPGMDSFPLFFVVEMTAGWRLGLTTNSAPASMVAWAWSAVVTVPDPSRSWPAYSRLSSASRATAPGTVMVTSTTVTPPVIMARTTAWAWATLRARRTGMSPTRSMICAVVSDILTPNKKQCEKPDGRRLGFVVSHP